MSKAKAGGFILWKRFGFCHILKDVETTLCGNRIGWMIDQYKAWEDRDNVVADRAAHRGNASEEAHYRQSATYWKDHIKYGKDARKRPLCGTCRKLAEKGKAHA